MPDFGFVGPSYEAPSIYQDDQECINFRPEIDPLKQPGQYGVIALYPTPGLVSKVTLNYAEVRGMRNVSGNQYMVVVCGGYVYVLNQALTPTLIGQLNTNTGIVGITDNGINVYIVDGAYRYTWRISNPNSANFTGSVSGTTLNVTKIKSGTLAVGQQLFGPGVTAETVMPDSSLAEENSYKAAMKSVYQTPAGVPNTVTSIPDNAAEILGNATTWGPYRMD
jgi:hypothetical protein